MTDSRRERERMDEWAHVRRRNFWERVAIARIQRSGMTPGTAIVAAYADRMLAQWRKRWGDTEGGTDDG